MDKKIEKVNSTTENVSIASILTLDSSDETDSDEKTLTIDCSTPKQPKKRKRKRKTSFSPDVYEQKLDKTIQETVQKFGNMTPDAAKKMLMKLVKNEHVLALVSLQAEKENRQKGSKASGSGSDENDDENQIGIPKLTRSKAKQLKKTPLPIQPLNASEPDEEVVKLIKEDLAVSDDEDEEYQPCEDEIQSDDDFTNTTMSDVESRPSTPGSALASNIDTEAGPSSICKEGIFKVPSTPLTAEEQENISRRTRSKVCLTETAIETIESSFFPPDITTDMYEFDQDNEGESEWKEFLNEFMKPLDVNAEPDEADDADPEYVACDKIPIDKEELREVRVSKKELNELISELLEMDGLVDDALITENPLSKSYNYLEASTSLANTSKRSDTESQKPKRQKTIQSTPIHNTSTQGDLETPKRNFDNDSKTLIITPEKTQDASHFTPGVASTPFQSNILQTPDNSVKIQDNSFNLSTPQLQDNSAIIQQSPLTYSGLVYQSPVATPQMYQQPVGTPQIYQQPVATPQMYQQPLATPQFTQVTGTDNQPYYIIKVPDPPQMQPTAVFVQNAQNQLELHQLPLASQVNYNPMTLLNQAYYQNGVFHLPQYQPIVLQVPTVDLLQNKLDLSGVLAQPSTSSSTSTSTKTAKSSTVTAKTDENVAESTGDVATATSGEVVSNLTDDSKARWSYREAKLKKFAYLNEEPPPQNMIFPADSKGFTGYQKQIFDQQIRMHTQLLLQNFIQTYGHPHHWEYADNLKCQLEEIKESVKPEASPFNAKYIGEVVDFVYNWEEELSVPSRENEKYVEHFEKEIEREIECAKKSTQFIGKFNKRVMERVVSSTLFIYPKLLPKIPFRKSPKDGARKSEFPNSEISIIAFGLERFHNILYKELNSGNPKKIRKPPIGKIIEYIHKYICFARTLPAVRGAIERFNKEDLINPIKYYFQHRKAPAFKHIIENVDLQNILPPKDHKRGTLAYIWNKYVFSNERTRRVYYNINDKEDSESHSDANKSSESDVELVPDETKEKTVNSSLKRVVYEANNENYIIEYVSDDNIKINVSVVTNPETLTTPIEIEERPPNSEELIKEKQTDHKESPKKSKSRKSAKSLTSILKSADPESSSKSRTKKQVTFDLPTQSKSRKLTRKKSFVYETAPEVRLNRQFYQIIQTFEVRFLQYVGFSRTKSLSVLKVYRWTRTIDIYTNLLKKRIVLTKVSRSKIMSAESDGCQKQDIPAPKKTSNESSNDDEVPVDVIEIKQELVYDGVQEHSKEDFNKITKEEPVSEPSESEREDLLESEREDLAEPSKITEANNSIDPKESKKEEAAASKSAESGKESNKIKKAISEEYSKRITKKLEENFHLITDHIPNDEYYLLEQDCAYAYNYFEHVLKTFRENGDDEMFDEFHNVLKTFDANFESVPELYHKMENLLLPKYLELLNLFLSFLLPEHASEIGKFFEHFIMTNMSTLLEKLNYYFKQQPSHIKKVYAALNECANDPDITMEKLKSKIIPLLKNNRLLIDWFLQLFDTEKPSIAKESDHERVYYKYFQANCDNESSELDELLPLDVGDRVTNVESCGVKYIDGKVIYRDRIILPAKLSFMAYNGVVDDSDVETLPESDDKDRYCAHEIRKHVKKHLERSAASRFPRKEKETDDKEQENDADQEDLEEEVYIKEEVGENGSKKSKKKVIKKLKSKYNVCDPATQKAHAIRLNPVVYARNGEKLSDVIHLLQPSSTQNNGSQEKSNDEKTNSPKKQNAKASAKKTNSPITQKKSQKISPTNLSPTNQNSLSAQSHDSPSTSKALQTSRKLKNLVDDDSSQSSRKKIKIKIEPESDEFDTDCAVVESANFYPRHMEFDTNQDSSEDSNCSKKSTDAFGWTRDEDKIILEGIQMGLAKTEMFKILKLKLAPRSKDECEERYDFLINFLIRMKKED